MPEKFNPFRGKNTPQTQSRRKLNMTKAATVNVIPKVRDRQVPAFTTPPACDCQFSPERERTKHVICSEMT